MLKEEKELTLKHLLHAYKSARSFRIHYLKYNLNDVKYILLLYSTDENTGSERWLTQPKTPGRAHSYPIFKTSSNS